MREEEVVKLLIKWLCKTADGGGLSKWWIPQQCFSCINILLIHSMPVEQAWRRLLSWCASVCGVEWPEIPNDSHLEGTSAPLLKVGMESVKWAEAGQGISRLTAFIWRQRAFFFFLSHRFRHWWEFARSLNINLS